MSNKPKKEIRLTPYSMTVGERYYQTICQIVTGKRGSTKKLKTLLGWAKSGDPAANRDRNSGITTFRDLIARIFLPA